MHYYNEHDRFAAAWLRELIADNQIPKGEVDERSIADVQPTDLAGFVQCHFFAGIGGWPYALRLAGWPQDEPVWTGSCPCQPFSSAGKQKGLADERYLWPTWFQLIRECSPAIIFGEQVEAAVRHGWLDGVFGDLEGEGYACGAAVLGAHSVGAPHLRQRLFWVANASALRCERGWATKGIEIQGQCAERSEQQKESRNDRQLSGRPKRLCGFGGLANPETSERWRENRANEPRRRIEEAGRSGVVGGVGNAESNGRDTWGPESRRSCGSSEASCACGLDLSASEQMGRTGQPRQDGTEWLAHAECGAAECRGYDVVGASSSVEGQAQEWERLWTDPWASCEFIPCADGKVRRVESGTFPLVARLSDIVVPSGDPSLPYVQATAEARQMRLRGYGNAIVPQVAAEFIRAYLECERRRGAARG